MYTVVAITAKPQGVSYRHLIPLASIARAEAVAVNVTNIVFADGSVTTYEFSFNAIYGALNQQWPTRVLDF